MRLRLPLPLLLVFILACQGSSFSGTAPMDALAYYNAATIGEAELLAGFDAQRLVPLSQVALNGWGFRSLVQEPSPRPGVLAAFEEAAPLGFSHADTEAAVGITVRQLAAGQGVLSGILQPAGLKFRHTVKAQPGERLTISVPAACLPVGEYSLQLCLRSGDITECADLPLVIGPYLQRERFHTYYWNAGGSNEQQLAGQIRIARLAGVNVLDTAYLPATTALKEGLLLSAHYVTIYQKDVPDGHAAVEPFTSMARAQSEAIGTLAQRYRHLLWCLPNSEYGSDRIAQVPSYEAAMREAGVDPEGLRLERYQPPLPRNDLPQLSPGVYAHDLPEIAAHRFARRHGMGWFELNRQSMAVIRARAPWLTMWTDPVVSNEQFEDFNAVSFWHYGNNPYQTIARTQRAECARRLSGARQVFLTLSQWYEGIEGAKGGWGLRSPDQHRFNGWLALTQPVHALGYWALEQLPDNLDCAQALRDSLQGTVYPYGTLLRGSVRPRAPVAMYVSTVGEFLGRAHRKHNFWAHTHYLNGVVPALYERFAGQVDWLDDGDVLAGRLADYQFVLCPMLEATTDELLDKLRAYQAGGGKLAGDEYWAVRDLTPALQFPGKSTTSLGLPYANASLPEWHRLNREAIVQWQPAEIPALSALLEVSTSSPSALAAVRDGNNVRFVVVANNLFRRGEFANRHGYTDTKYLDEGVSQVVEVSVKAPVDTVVYDVVHSRRVDRAPGMEGWRKLSVSLPAAGGALFALHPRPLMRVEIELPAANPSPGMIVPVTLRVLNDQGMPAGPTALRVVVRDARGQDQDIPLVHQAPQGVAHFSLAIPLASVTGEWQITGRDMTSGHEERRALMVMPRN